MRNDAKGIATMNITTPTNNMASDPTDCRRRAGRRTRDRLASDVCLSISIATPGSESVSDRSGLPRRVDRRTAAKLVSNFFFPISWRTLEAWPLTIRNVNGKATIETAELFAMAQAKLDAAPAIRGGRKANTTA